MRAIVPIFLAAVVAACGRREKTADNHKLTAEQRNLKKTITSGAIGADVYKKYIPDSIQAQLRSYLPKWILPAPNSWDRVWFNEYQKNGNGSLVNYVAGRFNFDDITDHAFILENSEGEFAVWAILSAGKSYRAVKVSDLGKPAGGVGFGLELIKKGKLQYIDLESDTEPQPIDLSTDALQVTAFERGATAYYWADGEMKSVTTGD